MVAQPKELQKGVVQRRRRACTVHSLPSYALHVLWREAGLREIEINTPIRSTLKDENLVALGVRD